MPAPLYAPAQVREMDARAIAGGVAEETLMERAAGHLARAVVAAAGRAYGLRVGVVCGKGHNGGDGLAAARRLADLGARADVAVVDGAEALAGLPALQRDRWLARGGRIVGLGEALARADVVVDCLLGTGTAGEPREPARSAIAAIDAAGAPVVACDLPTGVDAATGAVPGAAVRADVTVTLGAEKVGLRLWPARGRCGQLVLGDLGIDDGHAAPAAWALADADADAALPALAPDDHKRSRGRVLVVAGSDDLRGAAVLAGRGAVVGGAGLVTVAASPAARETVAAALPEALTLARPEDPDAALAALGPAIADATAVVVGPGLGRGPGVVALVRGLLAEVAAPLVLDADGLNACAEEPRALEGHASAHLVVTPHAGEYARLVGADAWPQRLEGAPRAAAAWRATVLAKGPGTLVAAADGRRWVTDAGGPALATGGTGDVLSGLLAAALASRDDPATVAAVAHLHGRAGELAAARGHPATTAAGDVVDAVPAARRGIAA